MAIKSFQWNSDPAMVLLGCGIDSEKISRFETTAREGGHPFPFIFLKTEIDHCRTLTHPAKGLCAAFCCKEALRKALAVPYNYTDCEALFDECRRTISLTAAESLKREASIGRIEADIMDNPLDEGVLTVVVSVSGPSPSGTTQP